MRPRWARAALTLVALGATLGTALDGIHTHFGATRYSHPVFWLAAWWVPLVFASAFTLGLGRPLLGRLGADAPPPTWGQVLLSWVAFVVGYFVSVLPLPWPMVSLLLALLFAASWWLCDRTARTVIVAGIGAVGGPLVESALVAAGTFVHLHPVALGVSGWLPFLYLCAGVALCTLARRLVDA
jgi:hypothetical protein